MKRRILFVHQNFPAQFRHLAPNLLRNDWDVKALRAGPTTATHWQGVHLLGWKARQNTTLSAHPMAHDTETKLIRAEAAAVIAEQLNERGWVPDLIVGHPGWGEMLFLNTIWPNTPQLHYLEFFYSSAGLDMGFDPEFSHNDWHSAARVVAKQGTALTSLTQMSHAICPTRFQASTYPEWAKTDISVIHDGIQTKKLALNRKASFCPAPGAATFRKGDPVLTFVSRNLEPYRGYHQLIRALPLLQQRCPKLHTVIVGGDGVSYGAAAPKGQTWKQLFWNEVASEVDSSRVWFTGMLDYQRYINLLHISACHIYLTYPFVLSWSCLEAMAASCTVIASDTEPVQEIIESGKNGILVDFFDKEALVNAVEQVITQPDLSAQLADQARRDITDRYDLQTRCLPRQQQIIEQLIS